MQLFYCPIWDKNQLFELSQEESYHAINVLRYKEGDVIHITDGKGNLVSVTIISASKKKSLLQFNEVIKFNNKTNLLEIGISLIKNNSRFDTFIEKSCEIGVGSITPIVFDRTEKSKLNLERLNKIIISACKQSKNLNFPTLNPITKFNNYHKELVKTNSDKYFCYISNSKKNKVVFDKSIKTNILVGPEGDFSLNEIELMKSSGYKPINFNTNILRVETAGIYCCCQYSLI